jgi:hypothetical protein
MSARSIAKQIAYGRVAIGAALLVKPELVTGRWVGPVAETPGGRTLALAFGARDLALGVGAAYTLHAGGAARPWLLAAAFTDTVDAVATFAARRSLPSPGGPATFTLAVLGATVGAWTATALD